MVGDGERERALGGGEGLALAYSVGMSDRSYGGREWKCCRARW